MAIIDKGDTLTGIEEQIREVEGRIQTNEAGIQQAESFRQYAMHSVAGYSLYRMSPGQTDEQWSKAADAAHDVVKALTVVRTQLRERLVGLHGEQARVIRAEAEEKARAAERGTLTHAYAEQANNSEPEGVWLGTPGQLYGVRIG